MRRFAAVLTFALCATSAQAENFWSVDALKIQPTPSAGRARVDTLGRATYERWAKIRDRVQVAAGASGIQFLVTDQPEANAFASYVNGLPTVTVTSGMVRAVSGDDDAFAALMAHEMAHLQLGHLATAAQRSDASKAAAFVTGLILGAAGVPMAGTLADVGVNAVANVFSRDQEREADATGLEYLDRARFDLHGAARLFDYLGRVSAPTVPFLSSHPSSAERMQNMLAMGEELQKRRWAAIEAQNKTDAARVPAVPVVSPGR